MSDLTATDRWYVQQMTSIGSAEAVFTNDQLDDLYTEASADKDQTVLLVWYKLAADASKLHAYRIAQSMESMDQVFNHVLKMIALWENKTQTSQQVSIVGMRAVPPRDKNEPSS